LDSVAAIAGYVVSKDERVNDHEAGAGTALVQPQIDAAGELAYE
jgi:hypothetical protein